MRRPSADWTDPADERILEFLYNSPCRKLNATPRVVEANIDYKISTCRSRCSTLRKAGLLEYYDEDSGIYRITDRGVAFLEGEMTDRQLAALDPSKPDDDTEYIDNNVYAEDDER
jgi:predicted transcriptional regulator